MIRIEDEKTMRSKKQYSFHFHMTRNELIKKVKQKTYPYNWENMYYNKVFLSRIRDYEICVGMSTGFNRSYGQKWMVLSLDERENEVFSTGEWDWYPFLKVLNKVWIGFMILIVAIFILAPVFRGDYEMLILFPVLTLPFLLSWGINYLFFISGLGEQKIIEFVNGLENTDENNSSDYEKNTLPE